MEVEGNGGDQVVSDPEQEAEDSAGETLGGDVAGNSAVGEIGFDTDRRGDEADGAADFAGEGEFVDDEGVIGAA